MQDALAPSFTSLEIEPVEPVEPVQRWALGIEFIGTHYRGWQTQQAGVKSVQLTLEKALSHVANQAIILHAAGRTDAGVHASNMVAHFDTTAIRPERAWIMGTNTLLPKNIAIHWAKQMPDTFHARFKAVARRYCYVMYPAKYRPAILAGQITHLYMPLDFAKMQTAAQRFEGIHDFSSFRAAGCQSNQPVRHVTHCRLLEHGRFWVLDIQANGFLHHMVRNIIGVLVEIGQGLKPIEWIDELFLIKDRTKASITAPPDGLYFTQAYYSDEFNLPLYPTGPHWLNLPDGPDCSLRINSFS